MRQPKAAPDLAASTPHPAARGRRGELTRARNDALFLEQARRPPAALRRQLQELISRATQPCRWRLICRAAIHLPVW